MSICSRDRHKIRAKCMARQGSKCFWCDRPLRIQQQRGGRLPDDYPTVDHLRDKFHPGRRETNKGERRYVVACPPCNHARGVGEQSCVPLDELQRRSGRGDAAWERDLQKSLTET